MKRGYPLVNIQKLWKITILQLGKSTVSKWAIEKIDFNGLVGLHEPTESPNLLEKNPW